MWRRKFWLLVLLLVSPPCMAGSLPTFAEVKAAQASSWQPVLDRHGAVLWQLRTDKQQNRLEWRSLEEISPALREVIVQAEDKRFYSHHGVDWKAVLGASRDRLLGRNRRGASTLTMQLAGLLDPALEARGRRSWSQKWHQAMQARQLEKQWTKAQILEAYLNLVMWRGDVVGVEAASRVFFKKSPAGLNREEALLLAAMLPAPNAPVAAVARHACALIRPDTPHVQCRRIQDLAYDSLSERTFPLADEFGLLPLESRFRQRLERAGPGAGSVLQTTLDADLQRVALRALRDQLQLLLQQQVDDAAAVVMDNRSGDIVAWVGNAGVLTSAAYVDGVTALRQAGSTLKPYLYALSFEQGWLTPASLIDDTPQALGTDNGLYVPQNYDKEFKGWVSVRTALAASLNIPAVITLEKTGVQEFHTRLQQLGYGHLDPDPVRYGFSLALGSADVSLLEQVRAFSVLLNQGVFRPTRLFADDPSSPSADAPVVRPEAAWLVTDILSDPSARTLTFGLDNPLVTAKWSAVKTGTSKDMRDNWAIGGDANYTVGVWVGNFDGSPMHDVSGVTGAAPAWHAIMQYLQGSYDEARPPRPEDLVKTAVRFDEDIEVPREEFFVKGSEMAVISRSEHLPARIRFPVDGAVLSLDPDIPERNQKLHLQMAPADAQAVWWLDGQRLAAGNDLAWPLRGGTHRLELRSATGAVLDQARFLVKGGRPQQHR